MAGVVIQTSTIIHENSIINTGALIDHECVIQKNVHIAPGAVVCGKLDRKNTFIGAGANILPNTIVPENSVVGAGKFLNNMIKGKKVLGVIVARGGSKRLPKSLKLGNTY